MDIFGFFKQRKAKLDDLANKRAQDRKKTAPITLALRINQVLDPQSATPLFDDIKPADPLAFPGYADKVASLSRRTNRPDAHYCATGTIEGHPVVCAELIPEFLMGSMGTAVGEAVCRSAEYALAHRIPLVIFCASGGARMQEGMFSLMQMAKTAAAIRRLSDAGVLYISVLTHPTTGGVTASFASLGDIILAEPDALIGFAGPRVIQQTIGTTLPPGFQRAEFQQAHGFVDRIIPRTQLRPTLAQLLALHTTPPTQQASQKTRAGITTNPSAPTPTSPINTGGQELATLTHGDSFGGLTRQTCAPESSHESKAPAQHVAIARNPARPHAMDFIGQLFEGFFELHGDRHFGDDHALIGGLASFEGIPVSVAAHLKGADLTENLACNFGMPHPEGYRKFIRLAQQAQKFGRPLVTFIDTPGAYPGAQAEERGQGEAIARCLFELSGLAVPTIAVVTGEGGSGGALALGLADRVLMYQYAIYSVLSPEGFASILWKDARRSDEASEVMKLTAQDLLAFGMVDAIVPEPLDGAHLDPQAAVEALRPLLREALGELRGMDNQDLSAARYERYRKFR